MDKDILVKVDGVSKKFCKSLKRSLWYGVKDIASEMSGSNTIKTLRKDEFWAIDDVSFELKRGECLGLIGHNGAGKSTLLKMLNGLIKPDKGSITMKGRIGALIELGAGFNPVLTGRENIYVNGQVLGFTKKEIDNKLDSIIEFSEIGDFIDSPVQNYSSGMKVRLGFAVAAQMEPDVLLIDEVLAVGDIGFQSKCLTKISELLKSSSVIFVSHSMPQINRYCDECLYLEHGRGLIKGNTLEVIEAYYNNFKQETGNIFKLDNCDIEQVEIDGEPLLKGEVLQLAYNTHPNFRIKGVITHEEKFPRFIIHFLNRDLQIMASALSKPNEIRCDDKGNFDVNVKLGPLIFNPGGYKISIVILTSTLSNPIIFYNSWWAINITGEKPDYGSNYLRLVSDWSSQ